MGCCLVKPNTQHHTYHPAREGQILPWQKQWDGSERLEKRNARLIAPVMCPSPIVERIKVIVDPFYRQAPDDKHFLLDVKK
mmetsp:Transcript_22517/g.38290  ORF Transcript_22517/g.38290 Transcript_22517/m.38290 type:complete len:81 (-) Transcript_22517:32-274(-)